MLWCVVIVVGHFVSARAFSVGFWGELFWCLCFSPLIFLFWGAGLVFCFRVVYFWWGVVLYPLRSGRLLVVWLPSWNWSAWGHWKFL